MAYSTRLSFSQSSVSCFILRSSKYACLVPGACEHSSRNCQGRRQTWNPKNQWTLYSFPSCIQSWRWWHLLTSIYLYVKSYILLSKRRLSYLELSFDGKVMGQCWKSEMQKLIFARIKDVDMVRTREVDLVYYSMAEVSPLVKSFVTLYPMFKWYGSNMLKVYAWFVKLLSGWTDSGHCYVGRMCEWWVHLMAGLMEKKCLLRALACTPDSLQQSSSVLAGEILDQLSRSCKIFV